MSLTNKLLNACRNGALSEADQLLNKLIEKTGSCTEFLSGMPLSMACASRNLEVVKWLVKNGADASVGKERELRGASEFGRLEIVKYLVNSGADIAILLQYPIGLASLNGHLDVVKYLVGKGADITGDDNWAVDRASDRGHDEVVKYIIDLVINGMKKHMLLLLMGKKTIHKDLIFLISLNEYTEHYRYYQEIRK